MVATASRGLHLALAALCAALGLALAAPAAAAEVGDVTYRECLSTATGTGGCTQLEGSALQGIKKLLVSPDGRHLYGAAYDADAIVRFDRDPASGALSFAGCLSSDSDIVECAPLPGAISGGDETPLERPVAIAGSADGRSVYATTVEDTILHFERDPASGTLAFVGCLTGDSDVAGCDQLPGATSGGAGTAISVPYALTVAGGGSNVYVIANGSDAIARFSRDPATGAIAYAGCLSSNSSSACVSIPGANASGVNTGLEQLHASVESPDGRHVYAVSFSGDAVSRFLVGPDGALSYGGCITSDIEVDGCLELDGAAPGGAGTALNGAIELEISEDGRHLYVASRGGTVSRFDRRASDGALTFADCITGNTEVDGCAQAPVATAEASDSGFNGPREIVLSGDGRDLYLALDYDSSLLHLRRDPQSGALAFAGCHSGNDDTPCVRVPGVKLNDTGLYEASGVVVSPDDRSLYVASGLNEALTIFDRQLLPAPPPGPGLAAPAGPAVAESAACAAIGLRRARGLRKGKLTSGKRPSVRIRLRLDRPAQIKLLRPRLLLRAEGRKRVVSLPTLSRPVGREATLRLRLPVGSGLKRGAVVEIRAAVRLRSATGCAYVPARPIGGRAKVF